MPVPDISIPTLLRGCGSEDIASVLDENYTDSTRLDFGRTIQDPQWISSYLRFHAEKLTGLPDSEASPLGTSDFTHVRMLRLASESVAAWSLDDYMGASPRELHAMYVVSLMAVPDSYCRLLDVLAVTSRIPGMAVHSGGLFRWYSTSTVRHPSFAQPVLASMIEVLDSMEKEPSHHCEAALNSLRSHEWFASSCVANEVDYDTNMKVLEQLRSKR